VVLEKNVRNKMDRQNNEGISLSKGERRKINLKILKKYSSLLDRAYN